MSARPDFRKYGYLEPESRNALDPDERHAEQCSAGGTRSRFYSGELLCFSPERYRGIKAVRVRSEWHSDDKNGCHRFKFGSGQTV